MDQVGLPIPTQVAPRQLDAEERSNVELCRGAAPSVVNICTKTAVARRTGEVTLSLEANPTGAGSGFVWDSQGHVVTNYHVVRDSDAVQVTLGDGSRYLERLVRTNQFEHYRQTLVDAFNPAAINGLMCRHTLSVGWDGRLFDCDFNQMLDLEVGKGRPSNIKDFEYDSLSRREIVIGRTATAVWLPGRHLSMMYACLGKQAADHSL